jgi:demethylmenaquinone methyltransferase/2-methoxy-6-polyprenyl-1,4-benzoquinol methylase
MPGCWKVGLKKVEKEGLTQKINLLQGDSSAIKFGNNSFDAVMVAFGVRNFENLESGLLEMCRVLKPGGQAHYSRILKTKAKSSQVFL